MFKIQAKEQVLNVNPIFQGQYESIQSMSFTSDNVEHIRVVCVALPVLDLKHPGNFITTVQLGVT